MKVVVCTEYGDNYKEIAEITGFVMKEYCERHGYSFVEIKLEDGNNYAYKKHEAFEQIMKSDVDLIWYLDADAIITNMKIPITDFVDDYYPVYITKDANELNGGSLIIKNNKAGRMFNEIVLQNRDMFPNEQNFYNSMPMLMFGPDIMKILPHPSINSYRYDLYEHHPEYVGREDLGDWVAGKSFVLHTPGLPFEKRIEVLKNATILR